MELERPNDWSFDQDQFYYHEIEEQGGILDVDLSWVFSDGVISGDFRDLSRRDAEQCDNVEDEIEFEVVTGNLVWILNEDTALVVGCPESDDDVDEEDDDWWEVDDLEQEFGILLPILRRESQSNW